MTTLSAPISPPAAAARKPWVRPWALAGPILLLLLCLPMLRPLQYPAELPEEEARLVEMVRQNLTGDLYRAHIPPISLESLTAPSPTFALVLTAPAWVMQKLGFDFNKNPTLMAYMLIAVGVTLPVALCAGLIYRMARLFDLSRPHRAALGMVCVAGSGLISYATTLSAHALAAALLIGATGCVLQALRSTRAARGVGFAFAAGMLALLAAGLDPAAVTIAVLMPIVFLAWRVGWGYRLLAVGLFIAGAVGPLALHRSLHTQPAPGPFAELAQQPPIVVYDEISGDMEGGVIPWLSYHADRLLAATFGTHGLLSHFPLLLIGAIGVTMLMHRNWPEAIKWLAAATLLGAGVAIVAIVLSRIDFAEAAFATRWFIAFSPLLLFWSGAWLRRPHGRLGWGLATLAMVFSITVGFIGAARPAPPYGYRGYTAKAALEKMVKPDLPRTTVARNLGG